MPRISDTTLMIMLLFFGASCVAVFAAGAELAYEDEIVVTCSKGMDPGKFYYFVSRQGYTEPGYPRCFGIDDQGVFYLPEVDSLTGIRVHKFKRSGKFKVMWGVKGRSDAIYGIALGPADETYLVTKPSAEAGQVVNKYGPEGRFLYHLGREGVLPSQQLEESSTGQAPLFGNVTRLAVTGSGNAVVVDGEGDAATVYLFDSEGKLLGKGNALPPEIEDTARDHDAAYAQLAAAFKAEERDPPQKGHTLLAPDSHLYYMVFDEKTLEIHRVTFPDQSR